MDGLRVLEQRELDTPSGSQRPDCWARLQDRQVAFLARHGLGHRFTLLAG
jgi:hypothetical protein